MLILAPLVVGRYFRGVRNGPSAKWMQDRLRAAGLRPISALLESLVGRPSKLSLMRVLWSARRPPRPEDLNRPGFTGDSIS